MGFYQSFRYPTDDTLIRAIDSSLGKLSGVPVGDLEGVLRRAPGHLLSALTRQLGKYTPPVPLMFRGSGSGKCPAKLGFEYYGYPEDGRQVSAQGRRIFMLGDLSEAVLVVASIASGAPLKFALDEQLPLEYKNDSMGIKVSCHPDGLLAWTDKPYESFEVKSCNDRRFDEISRGDPGWGYVAQANISMAAWNQLGFNVTTTRMLVMNKNGRAKSGDDLAEILIPMDERVLDEVCARLVSVKRAGQNGLAPVAKIRALREHKPGKDGRMPWPCNYCSHWRTCLADLDLVERGGNKTVVSK